LHDYISPHKISFKPIILNIYMLNMKGKIHQVRLQQFSHFDFKNTMVKKIVMKYTVHFALQ